MCGRTVIDAWLHSLHDVPAVRVVAGVRRLAVPPRGAPPGCPGWCSRHTGTCSASGCSGPPATARQATPGARATRRNPGPGGPREQVHRPRDELVGGPGAGLIRDRAGPGGATGRASRPRPPDVLADLHRVVGVRAAHHAQRRAHRSLPSRIAAMSSTVIPRWRQCCIVSRTAVPTDTGGRGWDRSAHARHGGGCRGRCRSCARALELQNYSRCDVTVAAAPSNCVRG